MVTGKPNMYYNHLPTIHRSRNPAGRDGYYYLPDPYSDGDLHLRKHRKSQILSSTG